MTLKTHNQLKAEIKKELMEEFIAPILKMVKDDEGDYKPEFVKKLSKALTEKPQHLYDPKKFLKLISS